LGVINIWYFRQVGDVPRDRPAYYFALVDPEFNPRPVYEALCQTTLGGASDLRGRMNQRTGWLAGLLWGLCAVLILTGASLSIRA
jgi:hypothetical protein